MSDYNTQNQYQPGPPPQYPQGAPPQKKSKAWLWVLAGCGTFVLLGVIAFIAAGLFVWNKAQEAGLDPELMESQPALAAAKLVTALNPDLELVSVDEEKGLITIREKKTGKTITVNVDQARNGKIVFEEDGKEPVTVEATGDGDSGSVEVTSEKGTVKIGSGASVSLPDWLPSYPGAEIKGTYSAKGEGNESASFTFTTQDSIKDVIAFYEERLRDAGFKVTTNTTQQDGKVASGIVSAENSDKKRTAFIVAADRGEGITVSVTYAIKN